ncbi:hypothetical protein [Paraburkholderia ginsengisoli]|uniref:Uncharacterized protein n=1 Tax=Paraburkholderia ginsengisoli TaxID=311231 RepID=A0A7T4NA08_9BURK|nr:hypothetical protein [Paraburkholderia ginsengisoli]QQC67986.1 hypothetical protein I6I06_28840 [Paraburkholderia ginsengisoli]
MLRMRSLRVTEMFADAEMCADYCDQTGQLRILQNDVLMREWFPPNSWIAIASVAGARSWGTRPDLNELRELLANQTSLLRKRTSSGVNDWKA